MPYAPYWGAIFKSLLHPYATGRSINLMRLCATAADRRDLEQFAHSTRQLLAKAPSHGRHEPFPKRYCQR